MPKEKVSQSQIYMLFSQYLYTTTLGFIIPLLIRSAQYMAWVSLLVGAGMGLVMTYGAYRLALKRPDRTFASYGGELIGKWLHYPLTFVMLFTSLFVAALILRELLDLILQIYLQDTPDWAIAMLFGCTFVYVVRSGVGTIFRAAQGFFFISVVWIFMVPPFVYRELNFNMAIALVNHFDLAGIWNGSYSMAAQYGEMAFIVFLFPFFAKHAKTMKSLCWAAVTSIVIVLVGLISTILLFGPSLAGNLTYPELELIRYIPPGGFFENLDPLIIAIWLSSLFIKISLLLFISVIGLTHAFGLKDHKPFSLSMTVAMVGLSLVMVRTVPELDYLVDHGFVPFLIVAELIPLLYLAADGIRTLFGRRKTREKNM
ncbi:MAG TPA: endospore germination permease [Paenibacillus cookii]|nr:endospore germination permease [Paenibacillus cookii]